MPEYSSTRGGAGFTVNTTYNPTTEIITTVVTAPNGSTATATTQRFVSEGGATAAVPDLVAQLQASGALPAGATPPRNLYTAVGDATKDVIRQADNAERAATATKTPVPENPAPPPSTNNANDPAVAPAPNNTPPIQSPSPPALVIPAADAALNKAADDKARADYASASPAEKRAIEDTTRLTANQLGGTHVDNPAPKATEIDEESAYPPNTVAQQSAEADELSAYPPYTQVGRTLGGAHVDNATPVNISGDPPIDRKMADADYTNNLIPTSGERGPNVGFESNKTALRNAQAGQTEQTAQKFKAQEDWRVRLSLAPGADYLYKVGQGAAGILNPLQATDGVIFPYTPAISVSYNAGYDATDVTHSNYKFFSYKNSNVDNVTITADFTAQDTAEAQYLLAVIHFFRSVTKMFYGKDPGPGPGVPPPLCYLNGLGSFQFDWHPLVINNFTYALPTDVDYIRAMDTASRPGVNVGSGKPKGKPDEDPAAQRMAGGGIQTGALAAAPKFKNDSGNKDAVTYVPTKMSITIQAYPIVSRNDVSNNFSLKEYATGKLLRGSQRQSGGFW